MDEGVKEMRVLSEQDYSNLIRDHNYLNTSELAKFVRQIENTMPSLMKNSNLSDAEKDKRFSSIVQKLSDMISNTYGGTINKSNTYGGTINQSNTYGETINQSIADPSESAQVVEEKFEKTPPQSEFRELSPTPENQRAMRNKLEAFFDTVTPKARKNKAMNLAKIIMETPGIQVDHVNLLVTIDGEKLPTNLIDIIHDLISVNLHKKEVPKFLKPLLEKLASENAISVKNIANSAIRDYIHKHKTKLVKKDKTEKSKKRKETVSKENNEVKRVKTIWLTSQKVMNSM